MDSSQPASISQKDKRLRPRTNDSSPRNGVGLPHHLGGGTALARGENLDACLRHQEGVLELCRALPIARHRGPVVGPGGVLPGGAEVDHGLDRERVPRAHDAHCFVLLVVWHVGRRVEERAYPVPAVALDDRTVIGGCHMSYRPTKVPVHGSRLDHFTRSLEAIIRALDQLHAFLVTVAHQQRLVQVSVVVLSFVLHVHRHVQVYNVAVLDGAAVGDPVANYFVRGDADRLGELVVIEGGGVAVALHARGMHDAIDLIACHTHLDEASRNVEHFAPKAPRQPHPFNVISSLAIHGVRAPSRDLAVRN
mmetsp:Transcript_51905/g.105682  ORF Transcript_51905/g.105682 Transcript_51905/m.105682 type:complete len:307 (+) Transcript_51905:231-1151(+)